MRKLLHLLALPCILLLFLGSCAKNYDIEDLKKAALDNDRDEIKTILRSKVWSSEEISPLLFELNFSKFDHHETAYLFLDNGADINYLLDGETVLSRTFSKSSTLSDLDLKNLLSMGADPTLGEHAPLPRYFYSKKADWNLTDVLLEYVVDHDMVNYTDRENQLPLLAWAAAGTNHRAVSVLLSNGADPDSVGTHGWTPLFYAVRGLRSESINDEYDYNVEKILSAMLVHGADITRADEHGNTLLTSFLLFKTDEGALNDGEISKVLKYLLKHGCNPNIGNAKNQYPLEAALEKGLIYSASVLIQYGANPFIQRKDGTTVFSVISDDETSIRQLINYTGLGRKALRTSDNEKVIQLLFREDGIVKKADPAYGTVDTYSRSGLGRKLINDLIRKYYHVS